jgi:putative protease
MKSKLLAPVSEWSMLVAAIEAKADAVYFGVKQLNMRITAKNFELTELKKITDYCHKYKVKAYLTLNTIIYDDEISILKKTLSAAKKAKIDGVICWDWSVIRECEKLNLPIHLSTQASISNFESLSYLKNKIKNLENVVLARELSLDQIKDIIKQIKKHKLKIGIETFIHGAMCVSVSGRCFMSQSIFNKSANRGDCIQPCRRSYIIKDPEEGHEFKLEDNYVMSPKDLCTIEIIDELIDAGISTFKIEGRNRSPEYVKVVVECYRAAVDAHSKGKLDKKFKDKLVKKLKTVYNRGFSTGFYMGKPIDQWTDDYGSKATKKKTYVGYIKNFYKKVKAAEIKLEANNIKINDNILIIGPTTGVIEFKIKSMEINNKPTKQGKKGQSVAIKLNQLARENDKVFLFE